MRNKIFMPKILNRRRINNILLQIFEVPLFFISAAMGYGKTISVKNFLEKRSDVKIVWFDTSYDNNDESYIWYKFCELIKSTNPSLSKKLIKCECPKSNIEFHNVVDIIRNELKQTTVIVIDDWYELKTFYINKLINVIVLEGIPNLHIVIISRKRPENQYIELELKQKCLIMWQDDIAYTLDETVEFFRINGVKLTDNEKRKVFKYTGGWTSATYLALLQYYNENTFDNIPEAAELLRTAIYDKFDETTKKILLKLSLLDKFTLEQAIYVTENEKTRSVIQDLLSNNCFIKYNLRNKEYILHYILRSTLREEALLLNIDNNKINNSCGEWYYNKSKDIEAMEYYYKAKNYERILDIIERNNTIDLNGVWKRIIRPSVENITMEQKVNRPIAYLTYLFFYIMYVNIDEGKELLYDLWVIYEINEDLKDRKQVLAEIAFLDSLVMFNDIRQMIKYQKKAYELLQGKISKIANNRMPCTFGSPHFLCLFHRNKGELKKVVEYLKNEMKYFINISNGGGEGSEYLMSAEYLYETGDTYNSELFAYKALHKAKLKNQVSIEICSLFLLMRICVNKNDKHMLKNNYDTLVNEYENLKIPSYLNGTDIALGYIDGITGNIKNMHKWHKEEREDLQIVFPLMKMKYVISSLSLVLKKHYIELEIQAEIMLEMYSAKNYIFAIIYAYIFDTIAKFKLYGVEKAKKPLKKALDLAKEDNIMMCFVELSPHMLPVIKAFEHKDEFIKVLVSKCEKFTEVYMKSFCNIETVELTPRELEVMKLVNEGCRQIEISQKLNIALVTVKKHIASVYLKLNVKNKTVAINLLKEKSIL